MGFALDISEAAEDMSEIISSCFTDPNRNVSYTPLNKVAHLYLISDILYNSSAPVKNASLFRTNFQNTLPLILDHLRHIHQQISGRMSANLMKEKILSVLNAWESWSLFPPLYLSGLKATFLLSEETKKDKCSDKNIEPESDFNESIATLRRECRFAGLVTTGTKDELQRRLSMLKTFNKSSDNFMDEDDPSVDAEEIIQKEDQSIEVVDIKFFSS